MATEPLTTHEPASLPLLPLPRSGSTGLAATTGTLNDLESPSPAWTSRRSAPPAALRRTSSSVAS